MQVELAERAMLRFIAVAAFAVAAFASEEEPQGAWLLSQKTFQSTYAVENMDYVVEYGLYNVGDRPATKISLDDRTGFPSQYFDIVRGVLQVTVERINPGENFTHAVVLKPLRAGMYNFSAAVVSYRPDEQSKELRNGLTSAPGEVYIYVEREYQRRFASKAPTFLVYFLLMSVTSVFSYFALVQIDSKWKAFEKKNH